MLHDDLWQEVSGDDSTAQASARSIVEHQHRAMKLYKSLKHRRLTPYNKETAEQHFASLDEDLDVVIALVNLSFLAGKGRIGTIPKRTPKGFLLRLITDPVNMPVVDMPKELPVDRHKWPVHLADFFVALEVLVPQLEREIADVLEPDAREKLSTPTVSTRGGNLVSRGYVTILSVGRERDNGTVWLVEAEI